MNKTYCRSHCPSELKSVQDFSDGNRAFRVYDPLYKLAAEHAPTKTWAEFGVGCGRSARDFARLLVKDGNLFLFDSWKGLPNKWVLGPNMTARKGSWKFPRMHTEDNRLIITDGWFTDTLPYDFPEQLGLVNIDCDVYSSTIDVLFGIDEYIMSGTVLVFDELIGYVNYREHEYKALQEWLFATHRKIEWLAKERFAAVGVIQ